MIRKAEAKDKESIKNIFEEMTGHNISDTEVLNRLQKVSSNELNSSESLYVYEYNHKVVGALGFRVRENQETKSRYGEISVIVVSEKFQKKGLGKQLMDFAETLAIENKCSGTWLVSGFGRKEKAHQFYKSLGYIPTGYKFIKHSIKY
ncbi:MAG: GNAT family N-acetyltransferase [Bacteroidota bacterium]|nr:GNAT family N-acetyltransferase [Bacteroidota bacterium]